MSKEEEVLLDTLLERLLALVNARWLDGPRGAYGQSDGKTKSPLLQLAAAGAAGLICEGPNPLQPFGGRALSREEKLMVKTFRFVLRVLMETGELHSLVTDIRRRTPLPKCTKNFVAELSKFSPSSACFQDAVSLIFAAEGVLGCLGQQTWFVSGGGGLPHLVQKCKPTEMRLSVLDAKALVQQGPESDAYTWVQMILFTSTHWKQRKVQEHFGGNTNFMKAWTQGVFYTLLHQLMCVEGPDGRRLRRELESYSQEDGFSWDPPFENDPERFLKYVSCFFGVLPKLGGRAKGMIWNSLKGSRFRAVLGLFPPPYPQTDGPRLVSPLAATPALDEKTKSTFKVLLNLAKDENTDAEKRSLCSLLKLARANKPIAALEKDPSAPPAFVSEVIAGLVSMLVKCLGIPEDRVRRLLGHLVFMPFRKEAPTDPKDCVFLLAIMTRVRVGSWDEHQSLFQGVTEQLWALDPLVKLDVLDKFCFLLRFPGVLSYLLRHRELYTEHSVPGSQQSFNIWTYTIFYKAHLGIELKSEDILRASADISDDAHLTCHLLPLVLSTNPTWSLAMARGNLKHGMPVVWLMYLLWKAQFNLRGPADPPKICEDLALLEPTIREKKLEVEASALEFFVRHLQEVVSAQNREKVSFLRLRDTLHSLANWSAFERSNRGRAWFPDCLVKKKAAALPGKADSLAQTPRRAPQKPTSGSPRSKPAAAPSSGPAQRPAATRLVGPAASPPRSPAPPSTPAREKKKQHTCSKTDCNGAVVKKQHSRCRVLREPVWLCPSCWQDAVDGEKEGARDCPLCLNTSAHELEEGHLVKGDKDTRFVFKPLNKINTRWSPPDRRGASGGPAPLSPPQAERQHPASPNEEVAERVPPPSLPPRRRNAAKQSRAQGRKRAGDGPGLRELLSKVNSRVLNSKDSSLSATTVPKEPARKNKKKKKKNKKKVQKATENEQVRSDILRAVTEATRYRRSPVGRPRRKVARDQERGKARPELLLEQREGKTTTTPTETEECAFRFEPATVSSGDCGHVVLCDDCSEQAVVCPRCLNSLAKGEGGSE